MEKKKIDSHLFKRLLSYFKPYTKELIVAFFFTIVGSFIALLPPLVTKTAIDDYITNTALSKTDRLDGVVYMILLFFAVLLVDFCFRFLKEFLTGRIGQKAIRDIRIHVFKHFQTLSLKYFDTNPIGRLMTRVTNDIEALNAMFTQGVVTIFGDLFMILGIVGLLIYINPELALWTFSVLPLLFIISFIFRLNVRKNLTLVRSLVAKLNAYMQENLTGMHIVKLFNREKQNLNSFKKINKEHTDAWVKNVTLYSLYFPTVELVSSVAVALIIWNAAGQMLSAETSFGTIVLFIQMAQMFFRPISDLSEKYNIIQGAMASSERIFEVLDSKTDIDANAHIENRDQFMGKIEFKNVWFSYKKEDISESDYVLKDISFVVEPGQHVAFVGHTGAGKSTIINLINRFYDIQKGQILIDDIDIRDWRLADLRSRTGIVLQDIYLFSGTVYENIGLHAAHLGKAQIETACKHVNADQFIQQLPDGYNTKVKERGSILSTGQKQLLSFARALVFDPAILILDEATASIDTETELLIQDALKTLMAGRTSIVIAHRLSTIKDADQIIVLHHGELKEQGRHDELMQNAQGLYFKLHQLQLNSAV
jgi:ATP-binding cassette subfamily B protein